MTFHVHADGAYYIAASGESFERGGYELRVIDITRDDGAAPVAVTVQFGAASYTATEGGTAATVTVNLSADPERSVTIPITAAGAGGAGSGDYSLSETSVTIDSGETSATFIVTATDDSVDDDGESVSLAFGTNLPDRVSRGAQATATVSLVDDDGATDTTAPEASSATVSTDGAAIDIVFDEDLDTSGTAPAADAFEVTVDGGTPVNPASVDFHASDADTVALTMSPAIAAGGTVTVAYDQPTSNALADAASNEVADFTQTALNRPAAPVVSLTAGNGKLTAAWTAPANGGSAITRYDVEWKTASQTWAQAATAGQSDTAAADAIGHEITGLTNDTEYTVRVRAVNGAGNGPWSAETSETPNPAAPGKPQNVQLVFEKTTSGYDAKLSWDAPEDLGGGTLQSYSWLLSKSVDGGNLVIESDDMQETAPAADSPIRERLSSPEIGDVYKLTVTVWNEAASASAARSAIFVLGETGAPEVTQAAMRSDGLLLAWSAPEIASSLDVTGYEARYKLTGAADVDDSWTTVAVGAASPYTITGLADSAGYNVRMRAVIEWNSGAYYGDWSEAKRADNPWIDAGGVEVSSDPASDETYGRNETIEFTVEFNEAVTVTGEPEFEFCLGAVDASCTEGENPPARRRAAHSSGDGTDKLVFSYVVGLRFTDLDTDGIRIGDSAIRLGAGEKIVSADTETAAHLGHAAPGIQTGHKVDDSNVADTTAPSVSSAKVSEDGMTIVIVFDQALDSSSTVAVGEFAVTVGTALPRKPSGAALSGADTVMLTMTPAIAAGETVSVAYTAPATGGLQDASNNKVAGFTESVINRPAKPTGLTLTAGNETLTASWTAPTATGGSAITGYDVEWKTAAQTWAEAATAGQSDTAAADATGHEITGLTNDTEYTVRVRATNDAGDGPWSVEASETPAVPASANADLADLSVEGVTVAGFDKDTLSYEVVVVLPSASLVTIETSTVNDQARVGYLPVATDASVASPGYQVFVLHKTPTTYTITVTSADGNVTKEYTIEITRYTLPGAPGGLDAQASYRQVELSWNDPDNSDIDSYQYRVSDDGGNTWDPDWTEIEGSDALTTGLTLSGLDHRTEYRFEVRAVVQGAAGAAASVTATADDDFPNDTTTTGEVDVGGSVTGTIEFGDDVDWVKVDLEADTRYQIDLEGADTGRGTLVDPAIEFLADSMGDGIADTEDSDNGVGKNARAIYTPTAADAYYVSVSSETSAPGTYTVSVIVLGANGASEADTDFPDTTSTTGRVEVGASATGNIHTGGNRDAFRVDLERGKTYQIDLEGAGTNKGSLVDPQLFAIANAAGSSISGAENNDISGSNLNSRVTLTPTATGSYYVLVRGNGTGTGTYTLSVRDVTPPDAPGGLNAQASYRQVELSWTDPDNSDIDSYQYRVSDDGGNTWDPDWTEIEGSGASTTGLTLTDLDHRTEYRFEVRVVVQGAAGAAASVTATPAGTGVPHDWDLRPPSIATGKTFRLLVVTSDRRNGQSGDVDDYNDHVQDAVTSGLSAIRAHSSDFRALVGTRDGASPRDNTHSNKDSDGPGEQIWWLNGPKAADNYADFYDGDWDHTNPVRFESGNPYTFLGYDNDDPHLRSVWTGARADGSRASTNHLGNDGNAYVGAPYYRDSPLRYENWAWSLNARIRLYGLSPVFLVEAPDAPYATTAAITSTPNNGTDYQTGEVVTVTVTFSEDVTVMGTPQLPLQIGGEERDADYVASDSSSTVLSFSYVVTDDDTDLDGISINAFALKLNGGSIKRTDTNVDAALTHTRVLTDDDQLVNLRPLITDIEVTSTPQATNANDTYGLGEDIEITVTFSEAVTVTGDVDFGLSVGGAKRARLARGNGTTKLVFAYTVQSGDTDTNGIFIGDQDSDNATLALQDDQSVVGVDSGLDALLEHEREGTQGDHKVDGSLTVADATLSSLTLSDITLVPAFAPGATAYTATTRLSSTTVTIAISQGQNGATGRITAPTDADLNASGHQVTLAEEADTVITITVTSSNGDSMRTYTVTVTRQPAIEADATLSVLALSGGITLVPAFSPRTTAYAATTSLSSTTVTATASQSGASMDIDPDDADTNTTDHDVNLEEGDTVITVTVISTNGDSTRTYTVTVTREAANGSRSAPPPPKNVRAVEEKGGVRLTWQPRDGAAVTGYRIERRRAGGQDSGPQRSHGQPRDHHTLVEDTGNTETSYVDESAEQGVEYEYRVTARNESGPGEESDWVRAGPASASNNPATGAPTISGTTQVGETLTADISGIADADGLSGETFTYQWVSSDGTTDTDIENATGSTYTLIAADQGKSVKVSVTFTDDGGNEETLTSEATGPVLGDGPPGAPVNLAATAGNKEVTLSWDPPADNGNAPATGYRIEWRVDGQDYDKNLWGTAGSTTYTTNDQANLANGVKYFFRVRAGNGRGYSYGPYGPASEEVSATPTSGSAVDLGTPVLSDTETLHHGMVKLDWEDIEDAGWYVVQYYHVKGGEWVDLPAEGVDIAFHGSSAVVSNLHGLSWLRVRAMSCAGASEWSQIEQLFGTNASDWEGVPVPEVAEGDEIEPCPVVLGTPVLSETEDLHHGMVQLDWRDIEDAGWYVVQYYHVKGGEWLDLPAEGVDIAFHGSSAVVSNLHGLSWLRVRAMSCAGASEWSQIEQSFGTNASDWEGVPVPEVAEGDEIEPCSEDADTPDNSPATGAPTISGTAQVGETLTANTSGVADADGLSNVQYEYQWLADDADISGATNATYTLVAADEGKAIKVQVGFTDDAGNDESLTSEPTAVVAAALPPPPDNVRAVTKKSGAVELTWDAPQDATVTGYRIERRPTGGTPSDQGRSAGSPRDNHTLVEDTGSTDTGYTDNTAERGVGYEYRVSARNEAGAGEESDWVNAEEATASNSTATGAPTISGTAQVGETLTANTSGVADADGLSSVQYEYQWLADDSDIAGATNATYTLTDSEESKVITVQVSFTDDADNEETLTSEATDEVAAKPNTPATGAPSISGTAQVGETLTANTSGIVDADGLTNAAFTYQWLADDADISGATNATYTLAAADEGKAITVQVSFTDDAGNEETLTSAATGAVDARPNSPATGAPTIAGTAQVGQTVTADTSGIADADGLANATFSYQWLADDTDIAGATGLTYTLTVSEESKAITVQVSFTDDADNEETLTSAATDVVAGTQPTEPPDKPTGFEATATHDSVTLTWDDPGDDSITGYVILRRIPGVDSEGHFDVLVADTGTAATTYTDNTVAAETRYTYRIKAINGAGTSERSRWSHIDTPAAPVPDKPTGLEATESHGQVVLTWDDPQDDSIIGYVILRRVRENNTGGDFSVLVADTGSAATTYTDDTVAAGATYTYRIKAINEHGTSERSRWVHIDTPAAP